MGPRLVFLLFYFLSLSSSAEYRAFLLKISRPAPPPAETPQTAEAPATPTEPVVPLPPDFRLVKSNLSAEQYPTYYPLLPGETIEDADTWMCRDRTGDFREICENPKVPRAPATAETTSPEAGLGPAGNPTPPNPKP